MRPGERRVSAPLVLAAASGMLAIAVLVVWSTFGGDRPEAAAPERPDELHVDDGSPEAAAQSFYDAWRRRRWGPAEALSVGAALRAVHEKRADDEALPQDQRVIAERSWEALAHSPLRVELDEVNILGDDRFSLSGVASYQLVGRPYRRRVGFDVEGTPGGYRVSEMRLGEVLTELPEILRGGREGQ